MAAATGKPHRMECYLSPLLPPLPPAASRSAAALIRQRRSCLGLRRPTALKRGRSTACSIACCRARSRHRGTCCPGSRMFTPPSSSIASMAWHPGLYLFDAAPAAHELRAACPSGRSCGGDPPGCPEHLALYLLSRATPRQRPGDQLPSGHRGRRRLQPGHGRGVRRDVRTAGRGGIAGCSGRRACSGRCCTWKRRRGVRGTGIGCYFDDAVHELLGLRETAGRTCITLRWAGRWRTSCTGRSSHLWPPDRAVETIVGFRSLVIGIKSGKTVNQILDVVPASGVDLHNVHIAL